MLRRILLITIMLVFANISQAGDPVKAKKNITSKKGPEVISKKYSKEEKWNSFWKDFTGAVNQKDKNRIIELTSKDFYDGGGGTVKEWLDMEVFFSDKHFNEFRSSLKKGARSFKAEGNSYKATGKNNSGDYFFEYKNEQWLFGGVVGD